MLQESLKELIKDALREVLLEKAVIAKANNPEFDAETAGRIVSEPVEEHAKRTRKPKEKAPEAPVVEAPAAPAAPAAPEVGIEELRKACADIAAKLGSSDKVKAVIAGFGGKVADVPAARRAEALEALNKLVETSTESWE